MSHADVVAEANRVYRERKIAQGHYRPVGHPHLLHDTRVAITAKRRARLESASSADARRAASAAGRPPGTG